MDNRFREILKTYWGYDDFRGIQRQIIESVAEGRDTLGLMPTGGGKSVTFQVPTLASNGLCLVITPLIALMKDQVANLRAKGIKATAVYNGMSRGEIITNLENCIFGDYKFLYVSPERLSSELFIAKAVKIPVALITVDEAHCISQWGYDFRPSYLQIAEVRKFFPDVPVLALTATATEEVATDIQDKLLFRSPNVFRMSFERKNLTYVVRRAENKTEELLHILNSLHGTAIVYTRNRKDTYDIAKILKSEGIVALNYHAGLTAIDKDLRQKSWTEGETRVIVATNAFGMGIDKADVRLVVHMEAPDSPEAYFQEAGRAGRDGKQAYAVLLYNRGDRTKLLRRIPENFPPVKTILDIYEHLAYYFQLALGDGFGAYYEFDIQKFCVQYRFFPETVVSALKILTRAGYIDFSEEEEVKSRVLFMTERDELYRLDNTARRSELVIQALLRNYGGLFADYVYIDENVLAERTGLTADEVHETLKQLSHQRIIHYIPHKRTPRIIYTQRREDISRIHIGPEVYDTRKEEYSRRIHTMIEYAESDVCHSRFLLNYFGEKEAGDCGKCELCLERKRDRQSAEKAEAGARDYIMSVLADGRPHYAAELHAPRLRSEAVSDALKAMLEKGEITMSDGMYVMPRSKA